MTCALLLSDLLLLALVLLPEMAFLQKVFSNMILIVFNYLSLDKHSVSAYCVFYSNFDFLGLTNALWHPCSYL